MSVFCESANRDKAVVRVLLFERQGSSEEQTEKYKQKMDIQVFKKHYEKKQVQIVYKVGLPVMGLFNAWSRNSPNIDDTFRNQYRRGN